MIYVVTTYRATLSISYPETMLQAKTLAGAKHKATAKFGEVSDEEIQIYETDGDYELQLVASRPAASKQWTKIDPPEINSYLDSD